MLNKVFTIQTLQRLPLYLNYLKALPKDTESVSATSIAAVLGLNHVQVRKDLATASSGGKPKTGYAVNELIADIEHFLGYDNVNNAVLVGAGKLGGALLSYEGFARFGLDIVAAFDINASVIGSHLSGKEIFPLAKLKELCQRMQVHMGIITVPADAAQSVCDLLLDSGVCAIWNFAPVQLNVPGDVLVHNENMANSLAVLSKHLKDRFRNKLSAQRFNP